MRENRARTACGAISQHHPSQCREGRQPPKIMQYISTCLLWPYPTLHQATANLWPQLLCLFPLRPDAEDIFIRYCVIHVMALSWELIV